MDCKSTRLPYRSTNAFSGIILDYLDRSDKLQPFYKHEVSVQGLQQAIEERAGIKTDRDTLVDVLKKQYKAVRTSAATEQNVALLAKSTTFTITTAHQPNIFTGPLYFIYKIIHVIRLAENCKTLFPAYDFVPVFYLGSEDADLDELGHFHLDGKKLNWSTKQKGAVGRMKVDQEFIKLIRQLEGRISVLPYGDEMMTLINESYLEGVTIQDATFKLVNGLFAEYGLVMLLPDNADLKRQMLEIFKDDLLHQSASGIVEKTATALDVAGFKVQAHPREINLFYLKDDMRERLERTGNEWRVINSDLRFSESELLQELTTHPERFSPNVILRGLYQETILPNIAFVGGGGETAYWLQLKDLFAHYHTAFPVLILRNSFLVIDKKWQERINKLGFEANDFFLPEQELLNKLVARDTDKKIKLNGVFAETEKLYSSIRQQASSIDTTLEKHVEALKTQSLYRLQELEKKMLRAEKRKYSDQLRQIKSIREKLFPGNGLQERVDNIMPYYSTYGKEFIQDLYKHSLSLEQEFVVLEEC